jgi:3'(2'), 5'-bisphosphate nucleotidase
MTQNDMISDNYYSWIPTLERIAREAGQLILSYRANGYDAARKEDNSPVTEADRAADRLICDALSALTPHIPIISEEGTQDKAAAASGRFWCVDPLDGTKGFIRGEDEFTVNIGLIDGFAPVLGVIYIPPTHTLYTGAVGYGATRSIGGEEAQPIRVRLAPPTGLAAVTSRHHGSEKEQLMQQQYGITSFVAASSSLKFCRIAEGAADIYPRFGNTMEWDTAAGHAILLAAGGSVTEMGSTMPLCYGKPDFLNGHFVARGSL